MSSEPKRPATRADCANGPRPCPWAGCRFHLLLDVNHRGSLAVARNGNARRGRPRVLTTKQKAADIVHGWINDAVEALDQMPETCALDVAERGEHSGAAIGRMMGFSKERASQLCEDALFTLQLVMPSQGIEEDLGDCAANDSVPRGCSPLAAFDLEGPRAFSASV